jgi:NAD(P)-dependent dehydrogenase (short-subunit alcohol dehydrogenase family)
VVVNDIGASLTGDGRDSGAASKVVNEITERGGIAVANTDSIAEMVSANRIITTAVEHFGRIDAVINNAGILRDRLFSKMSEEEWTARYQCASQRHLLCVASSRPPFQGTE